MLSTEISLLMFPFFDLRDRIDGFNNCGGVICPQKEEKTFPVKRSNLGRIVWRCILKR